MQTIIENARQIIIQIATPYSMGGTGFFLNKEQLIITNEHLIRDNKEVIVAGESLPRQLAKVVFTDSYYDLAFLALEKKVEIMDAKRCTAASPKVGEKVLAMGHPFGASFSTAHGLLFDERKETDDFYFYQHDAVLSPADSGGPLFNESGELIGVNSFGLQKSNQSGLALPIVYLNQSLQAYLEGKNKGTAARCFSCQKVVFESDQTSAYCPNCGAHLMLPAHVKSYEPVGTGYTIEQLLKQLKHEVKLARRGLNTWEIKEGSANILISYHEDSGLITCDAHLCHLPGENLVKLYQYLLSENYKENGLSFSVKGHDIILSTLIYDRYLNVETGVILFKHLFERADYYDNILVDQFGAKWDKAT